MIAVRPQSANIINVAAAIWSFVSNNAQADTFLWPSPLKTSDKASFRPQPQAKSSNLVSTLPWQELFQSRLSSISGLKDGWDGVNSITIDKSVLAKSARLLDVAFSSVDSPVAPAVVPCGDGSLQLEWRLPKTRFEIDIEPNGSIEAWALDRSTGVESMASGLEARSMLIRWAPRLSSQINI